MRRWQHCDEVEQSPSLPNLENVQNSPDTPDFPGLLHSIDRAILNRFGYMLGL